MTTVRILDLFSGAGGAAMGYHLAFPDAHIVGVDIRPQPRYPFSFLQADAMGCLENTTWLRTFDLIHASPPCQGYSSMRHLPWLRHIEYPMLLEPTWQRLTASGVPFVIENVERAPMPQSIVLCGITLGLPLQRHRRFGSNLLLLGPPHQTHREVIHPGRRNLATRYRQGGGRDVTGVIPPDRFLDGRGWHLKDGRQITDVSAAAMGIDWMTRRELSQAIPPAYTQWIGELLAPHLVVAG